MQGNEHIDKLIFGLKLRYYRQSNGLSFNVLSKKTAISISYLNEIEKGKKYPKEEKIRKLAEVLSVSYEELTSQDLPSKMAPVEELLKSNFLNELPLDLFGIDLSKVIESVAGAPGRVGAFISTLIDISKNYAFSETNFYFGSLRSFLEINHNYFEELEEAAVEYAKDNALWQELPIPVEKLRDILFNSFDIQISNEKLEKFPEFRLLRSLYLPRRKELILSEKLNNNQQAFQLGKEIGFQSMRLTQRAYTSKLLVVNSFEEVLNHFKAGYFSAALIIPRELFLEDLKACLSNKRWEASWIQDMCEKYNASPAMIFQRITNLLPSYFNITNLYFQRISFDESNDNYFVDKELQIDKRQHFERTLDSEHLCRRRMPVRLLKDLWALQKKRMYSGILVGCEKTKNLSNGQKYICISAALNENGNQKSKALTLGIQIESDTAQKVRFVNDPNIHEIEVNATCERCPNLDCGERVKDPIILKAKISRKKMLDTFKALNG